MTGRTVQQCWVAAVIRDDTGNVLIARSSDSQAWDLPVGPLFIGEDVCSAVRRVVSESVTLGVSVGWLAGIHSHIRDGVTLVFLAKHVTGRPLACGDVQTCRWVEPARAVRLLWPRRAEQLVGALGTAAPQPVVVPASGHRVLRNRSPGVGGSPGGVPAPTRVRQG